MKLEIKMNYWKCVANLVLALAIASSIQAQDADERNLKRIRLVGNNGRGFGGRRSPFPLRLCQGDCDTDDDCRGDLVCFQRGPFQPVPGCRHGSRIRRSFDICVPPSYGGGRGGSGGGSGGGGGGNGDSFFLKLYWQPGYFWQEERIERKWCMRCRNGCRAYNDVAIFPCYESPTRWTFVHHGPREVQIKVHNQDICMEAVFFPEHIRRKPTIHLKRCDPFDSLQRFVPTLGSFDENRFEITPKNKPGWCLTQRHHPKNNERVEIERCEPARQSNDETSFWNKY